MVVVAAKAPVLELVVVLDVLVSAAVVEVVCGVGCDGSCCASRSGAGS